MILHPDEPTYYPSAASRTPSTIDLVLAKSHFSNTDLIAQPSSSDHCYVIFDILTNNSVASSQQRLTPCYRLADWEKYQDYVRIELNRHPFPKEHSISDTVQIDRMIEHIIISLNNARDAAVSKVQRK